MSLCDKRSKEDYYSREDEYTDDNERVLNNAIRQRNAYTKTSDNMSITDYVDTIYDRVNEFNNEIRNNKNEFIKHYFYEIFKEKTFDGIGKKIKNVYDSTLTKIHDLKQLSYEISKTNVEIIRNIENIQFIELSKVNTSYYNNSLNKDLCDQLESKIKYSFTENDDMVNKHEKTKEIPLKIIIQNLVEISLTSNFMANKKFFNSIAGESKEKLINTLSTMQNQATNTAKSFETFVNKMNSKISDAAFSRGIEERDELVVKFKQCVVEYNKICVSKINILKGILTINNRTYKLIDTFIDAVSKIAHYGDSDKAIDTHTYTSQL